MMMVREGSRSRASVGVEAKDKRGPAAVVELFFHSVERAVDSLKKPIQVIPNRLFSAMGSYHNHRLHEMDPPEALGMSVRQARSNSDSDLGIDKEFYRDYGMPARRKSENDLDKAAYRHEMPPTPPVRKASIDLYSDDSSNSSFEEEDYGDDYYDSINYRFEPLKGGVRRCGSLNDIDFDASWDEDSRFHASFGETSSFGSTMSELLPPKMPERRTSVSTAA
jgi:hypothetical protein